MVCSFAISTARGILPLSGTMDLAPVRSDGATNATCPRVAQAPIISASGIPHGMHGKHVADADATSFRIVLLRNRPAIQALCSVRALCRAHGSWNKQAHVIFILVFMLQLYLQWPMITLWTLLSATRPTELTHEMLQEKLKIVRAMCLQGIHSRTRHIVGTYGARCRKRSALPCLQAACGTSKMQCASAALWRRL